jgi:CheY-like chemotaxis protein
MPSPDELHWVKSTANELNNLLQVITESSNFLQRFTGGNPEAARYHEMMRSAVDRAAQLSRTMLERSAANAAGQSATIHTQAPAPAMSQAGGGMRTGGEGQRVDVKIANPEGARELILIVDDEDFVTLLAQRVLTDEGYRVVTARDGFVALDIYKKLQNEIKLVILDFTMPIMDGSEVFSELRMINPQVPVVLSSGFTEQDKLKWMLAKGLRGFIPKPYTQQKLLLQVRSTLDAMKGERR